MIRYNCLYNIGEGDNRPDGIYFDDMLSGQTAYGNLIVRAKKYGFLIGGGRDIHVYNNVIIDCGKAITYDDRGYDGLFHDGWARHAVVEGGCMWERLAASPYQTEIWKKHYPSLGRVSSDFSNPHDPNFAVNPANSHVHDNLIVDETGLVGRFDEACAAIAPSRITSPINPCRKPASSPIPTLSPPTRRPIKTCPPSPTSP